MHDRNIGYYQYRIYRNVRINKVFACFISVLSEQDVVDRDESYA